MVLDPPTPNEIYNTIFTLKTKVNPDQDLPSFFLKIAAPILVPYLAIICYHSYQSGIFPDRMKIAKVIPIYKAGVTTDVNNYRPVSVLPCLSKVFEKLLLKRLNSFFEKNDIIQPDQYGFRQKHSTVHALMHTVTRCYDAMNEKFFSSLIMVDLRKAFDTVCHKKLLKKLDHYGIRGIVNELISNYLFNRKQYVYLNGVRSSLQPINIGVPQGSILGPLLYLIYVNDLPNCLECIASLYADDTCMIVHDQCLSELEGKVCKTSLTLKFGLTQINQP